MPDTLTQEQRRRCMSHIRSKNTKPEILVRHELFRRGVSLSDQCQQIAWKTRHCFTQIQNGNFYKWMFLARA